MPAASRRKDHPRTVCSLPGGFTSFHQAKRFARLPASVDIPLFCTGQNASSSA